MNRTTKKKTLNDLLGNVSLEEAARATMAVADAIQGFPSQGARLAAVCSAFVLTMELTGLNYADSIGISKNIIGHAQGRRPEFLAVQDYMAEEVFGASQA